MGKIFRAYVDAFGGLPKSVWLLSSILLVNRAGTMVLVFLSLYLTRELGFELKVAGQMLSVYGVGHLLGAFIGGWLCDRLGAIRIQFWSLILSGLGYLVMEQLRTLPALFVTVLMVATFSEAFRPANAAALTAFTPPKLRTRAFALNRMALNLGFSLGPALGGWLAEHDYSLLFWVDGGTCLAAGLLLRALFRASDEGEADAAEETADGSRIHPLRDSGFLAFLVLVALTAAIFLQVWSTYPVFLREAYGFGESRIGLLMAYNGALILVFEMLLTRWAERFRPLAVAGVGAGFLGISLALLPLAEGMAIATLSMTVLTVGEMLNAPFASGWVANRASQRYRGQYMGLFVMAWGVAFIVSPFLGTWAYQNLGADGLWFACGACGVLAWVAHELLDRHLRRKASLAVPSSPDG